MKRVFVDTGGFFANLVEEDAHRETARQLLERACREHWTLITTNAVIFETYALLLTRTVAGRRPALAFLDDLRDGLCRVERVASSDEVRAIELLRAHEDKGYSFCDALSFVVMDRLRITEAIAFDRHFVQYGRFTILQ
jgi:predicted nucleic acid-binding protein